jgi:hypothetical protein
MIQAISPDAADYTFHKSILPGLRGAGGEQLFINRGIKGKGFSFFILSSIAVPLTPSPTGTLTGM